MANYLMMKLMKQRYGKIIHKHVKRKILKVYFINKKKRPISTMGLKFVKTIDCLVELAKGYLVKPRDEIK
jgi:hypothetical protein